MELKKLKGWFERARNKVEKEYNVSFRLFVIFYVVSFAPFYGGLFMATQGVLKKSAYLIALGLIINRFAWTMPYLYPYFCGTLPKKIKTGILVWIVLGFAYGAISISWN